MPQILPAEVEDQPDRVGIERHGEQQMGGEAVVADRRAVDQAGSDHRPAERALQAAQYQECH